MPVSRYSAALAVYHNRNIRAGRSVSCAAHMLRIPCKDTHMSAEPSLEGSHIWKLDSEESGRAGIPISASLPREHVDFSLL